MPKWRTQIETLIGGLYQQLSIQHSTARPTKYLDVVQLVNVLPCYLISHEMVCEFWQSLALGTQLFFD
jgi:hypothetical protein